MKNHFKNTRIIFLSLLFFACEPIATEFDDIEDFKKYYSMMKDEQIDAVFGTQTV